MLKIYKLKICIFRFIENFNLSKISIYLKFEFIENFNLSKISIY